METILDAVVLVLKRHGIDAVTTNRIAEVAGVSIGSVYQYFPDKRAIFDALHDRPVEAIGRVIDGVLVAHAASSLADFVRGLVEALVDAHASDAEFHQLMTTTVPHGAAGANALVERLRAVFRIAITSRTARRTEDRRACRRPRRRRRPCTPCWRTCARDAPQRQARRSARLTFTVSLLLHAYGGLCERKRMPSWQ